METVRNFDVTSGKCYCSKNLSEITPKKGPLNCIIINLEFLLHSPHRLTNLDKITRH